MFHRRPRLRALLAIGLALFLTAPLLVTQAAAKTLTFRNTGVNFPINVPDKWRIKEFSRGVELSSPDKMVFIWVEATDAANVGAVVDGYYRYFRKQGVKLREPIDKRKTVFGGVDVVFMDVTATYSDGPTILRLVMTDPRPGERRGLFIAYWASPKGDKQYDDAVGGIMTDLLRP